MLNRGKMEIENLPDLLTVRELAQVIRKRPEAIALRPVSISVTRLEPPLAHSAAVAGMGAW